MNEKRKKQSYRWLLSIGLVVVVLLLGWKILGNDSQTIEDDGKVTIGFCADNLVIERWQKDQEIFLNHAKERGVEVEVYNANEDNATQNRQIRTLIDKQVDVIVVIPYDKDGISGAINEAAKAGIKIIAYDRLIFNANIDAYISFDNVKIGEKQAESLLDKDVMGNYVIINGSPEDNNSFMFNEGAMKTLSPFIESGDITIIEEIWAENWREEPAYDVISRLLNEGVQIDGIIGANDRLAEAAIRALAEKGLAGEVAVAGNDADISACQRIVEGTQYSTVYKQIDVLAKTAVDLAIQLVEEGGGTQITSGQIINNGLVEVEHIKLDVTSVTVDNIKETVIADGFHDIEDIYRD